MIVHYDGMVVLFVRVLNDMFVAVVVLDFTITCWLLLYNAPSTLYTDRIGYPNWQQNFLLRLLILLFLLVCWLVWISVCCCRRILLSICDYTVFFFINIVLFSWYIVFQCEQVSKLKPSFNFCWKESMILEAPFTLVFCFVTYCFCCTY